MSEIVRDRSTARPLDRSTAVAAAALVVATALARIGLAGYDAPMMASASWWCIGCCIGLIAVRVLTASMSLLWAGAIAAIVFVQKVLPLGERSAGLPAWLH